MGRRVSPLAPWYWNQLAADAARLELMTAERDGSPPEPDSGPLPPEFADAYRAMLHDPEVFRAVMETVSCLATPRRCSPGQACGTR
jgi:hypothetical protein